MMTMLLIVLGSSLLLFVISLAYAVISNWLEEKTGLASLISDPLAEAGFKPKRTFDRAARRPVRILGTFIF